MPRHFLRYLPWHSLEHWTQAYGTERYAGSEQFDRIRPKKGDVMWGVSIPVLLKPRRLSTGFILYGKLQIERCTFDAYDIVQLMGTTDIWRASQYVIAAQGTEAPYSRVDVSDIAPALRFEGKRDRLAIFHGRISAQQLQCIRELSPASAALLEEKWSADQPEGALTIATSPTRHTAAGR